MEITDNHHDGEANDQVLYGVQVTIFLNVGQCGACDVCKAQSALNNFDQYSWIITLKKPRIDDKQKSDNIIAQAHQKPLSSHFQSLHGYVFLFLLKLLGLYKVVTSSCYRQKFLEILFHVALLRLVPIVRIDRLYFRLIKIREVTEIFINWAHGLL